MNSKIRWRQLSHSLEALRECPTCKRVLDEQALEEFLEQLAKDDERFAKSNKGRINYELDASIATQT